MSPFGPAVHEDRLERVVVLLVKADRLQRLLRPWNISNDERGCPEGRQRREVLVAVAGDVAREVGVQRALHE
eukprot:1379771-Lingulodinium_polyedra.AAC.1